MEIFHKSIKVRILYMNITRKKTLTEEQVQNIRELYATGLWSRREIAEKFGVKHHIITASIKGVVKPKLSFEHKLWSKIDKKGEDECWLYTGGLDRDGYGHFYYDGKTYQAHRAVHEVVIGPIPKDYHVCHACDNPTCCNPKHLVADTPRENMRQKIERSRDAKPNFNHKTRWVIRHLIKHGQFQQRLVGELYGINGTSARNIAQKDQYEYVLLCLKEIALHDIEEAKRKDESTRIYKEILVVLKKELKEVRKNSIRRKM
jgi:predicted DNA-binding protein YlxM (UPF0122 family)